MNLPLHYGLLGVLEAGGIALLVGLLVFALCNWLGTRWRWGIGHVLGWSLLAAFAIAGGVDAWNMFYIGMVKLESPLYARLALKAIHNPETLGMRVVAELVGVAFGVMLGWLAFSRKSLHADTTSSEKSPSSGH